MTYKKLLAKINKTLNEYESHPEVAPEWLALRAVVKLHRPIKPNEKMCQCDYCVEFDCEACRTFYPCTTIQAIEKELM